jgi:hydroxymethylglutaryl-CoA lyase
LETSLPRQSVEIVEVGPRDGLQSEPVAVDTAVKVGLIERLLAAGIRRVEVASFVNPRKVPQMADAEQVFARLPRQSDVGYIGLVLNRRGFERAVAAGCREVGMVIAASDTFNRRNQGAGTADSIAAWREIAQEARNAGVRAHVTIATAFGCPFEGEIPMARVTDLACQVAEEAPVEIALADTIGVAVPRQVTEIVPLLHKAVPQIRLRAHFHNTRNMGIANAQAAIDAGITILDASIGGLGGCPFAPGATGNIATEDLLYLMERSGIRTGISIDGVIETARWLQVQIGRPLPGLLMKAGLFRGGNPQPA